MSLIWFQDEIFTVVRDNLQIWRFLGVLSIYYIEEQTLTSYQPEHVRAHTHIYPLVLRTLKNKFWVKLQFKIWKSQRTGESTIKTVLKFFQRTKTNGSLILKYSQKRNQQFFQNSKNHPKLSFKHGTSHGCSLSVDISHESVATGQLSTTTRKMKKIPFSLWKIHIPSINRLDVGKPTPTLWHVIVVIELTAHNMLSGSCWYQMLVVISCNNVV
jgi:hypothetical protein